MMWACERFADYVVRLKFHTYTDHTLLVPLFCIHVEELPLREQRFQMKLMRFDFSISHIPGKELITNDAVSRAAPASAGENSVTKSLRKQEEDKIC